MGKPRAPKPPDPVATAAAQTGTNVASALANSALGQMDQVTPDGSITYSRVGQGNLTTQQQRRIDEMRTNAANLPTPEERAAAQQRLNNFTGRLGQGGEFQSFRDPATGQTMFIPRMQQVQTLSPDQERLRQLNVSTQENLGVMGRDQSARVNDLLSEPLNLDGLPEVSRGEYGRSQVQRALMSRLQPSLDREREALQAQLSNQGIKLGSTAFDRGMQEFGRNANDARMSAILGAGQESDRIFGQSMAARQQGLDERFATRNQPLNEINALLSGSQVSQPTFRGTPTSQMATTDFAGLVNQNFAQRQQNYGQAMGAYNSMMGNLFGTAGNIGAAMISDERVKDDIRRVGQTDDGQPLYRYRYKGALDDGKMHIGLMAQDVQRRKPEAVVSMGGILAVDYDKALGD